MRRADTTSMYTSRAYYFGVLSLILLFVERGLSWTLTVSENRLPSSLVWISLILASVSTSLCVFNAVKGRKEPASVKKGITWLLVFIVVLFVIYVLYQTVLN